MNRRLSAITVVAKGMILAALVLVGASVVHNVTVALMTAVSACGGVMHTAALLR